jgi:hypothetical protein
MKPVKTFSLPQQIVKQIGKEWDGKFTVHLLNAREYLEVGEDLIAETRSKNPSWNGELPETELRYRLVCKAVTFNDKSINPETEIPSKLYEILQVEALPINTLSRQEVTDLFLPSPKANRQDSEKLLP